MIKKTIWICIFFFGINLGWAQGRFFIEEGKRSTRLDFELINNLIIIPVELNGVPLSFLLDTGVNTTVLLNLNEGDSLSLESAQRIQLRGLGGEELINAYRSTGNLMKIGQTTNRSLNLFIIYDEKINFSPRLGVPVHGIIGTDFFQDFVVEINYQRKFLRIHDPLKFKKSLRRYQRVPLSFYQKKPYVEVGIITDHQEMQAHLLLDNGLSDASWLFPETLGMQVPSNSFPDFLGLGLLGDVVGKRSRIKGLTLGNYHLKDVTVSFPDSLSVVGLQFFDKRNGSLGSEILRRFDVVFNYAGQEMFLKKNSMFRDEFNYDMSGIVLEHSGFVVVETFESAVTEEKAALEPQGDEVTWTRPKLLKKFQLQPSFRIARLRPESPAALSGLQVGDIIVEANGKKAYKYSLRGFTDLFSSEDGRKIRLLVSRNGILKKFEFRLKKVL